VENNSYFNILMYCSDLKFQCALFDRSFKRLEIAAEHWIKVCSGKGTSGEIISPLEIMAECTVCLSAVAAIRRMLYPSKKSGIEANKRGAFLLKLLNLPLLKCVSNATVRNSWEHNDQRLDNLLRSRVVGKTRITDTYVSTKVPEKDIIVLRRFNPVELSIYFSNDKIDLKQCSEEISELLESISSYYQNLEE